MNLWSTFRAFFTAGKGVVGGLSEKSAGNDPLDLFHRWFEDAKKSGIYLPESMALGTATADGRPSVRFVLLKGYDERGFVFFTNYGSRKADHLRANPHATLIFHWAILQRQVRLEGTVRKISKEESEAYFRTRARGSRIGAWASRQSEVLESREELEARVKGYEEEFEGRDVPLPPFWGGYRLSPHTFEFWQGRANRLHDRFRFVRGDEPVPTDGPAPDRGPAPGEDSGPGAGPVPGDRPSAEKEAARGDREAPEGRGPVWKRTRLYP
jgi:pyridoxamine 5'-phosphate oxidase